MNHSIHSADRATHVKVVMTALVAGVLLATFGIAARPQFDFSQTAQTAQVLKADRPVVVTSLDTPEIR